MLPFLLTILTLWIPIAILKPFSKSQKTVVLAVILLHLLAIFTGHYLLITQQFPAFFAAEGFEQGPKGYPIVIDSEGDAWTYYEKTREFEDYRPFSISTDKLVEVAGGRTHLGYYYVLGNLTTLTAHPVLSIRVLKTLIFFAGLACVMRVWRRNYGDPLPMYGFIFLTLLFMAPLYYNFRNLKDGLLFGLFLFYMALLDTLLRPSWQRLRPVSKSRLAVGWALILALLWMISTLRQYYAVTLAAATVMHFITASDMRARIRVALLVLAGVVTLFVLRSTFGQTIFDVLQTHPLTSVLAVYEMFRGLVTPIPWQFFIPSLIPTHCFYLLLLPFAAFAFFARFRKNLTWHLYTVMFLIYVLGGMLGGDSALRKRLIMVPILITWVLSYLAQKRGTHIDQTQDQLLSQEPLLLEFSEYDRQEELAYHT